MNHIHPSSTPSTPSDPAALKAVVDVLSKARFATVTTADADGSLLSRPMALLDKEFDGNLYFFTQDPSDKTAQVRAESHVNVAAEGGGNYVSIAGHASISKDPALIDELWNRHAEAWFDQGREDPSVALLVVDADSAEVWTTENLKVVAAVKYAKAILTGGQPDVGDSARVEL
ncbi:pyridoxamine 5'-phosphate oxidase family protein [Kineococcus gynurae]|uniref:Pyridoxamine 5'-phosphate oxidase family protein n=1 Tax=Kineococcus gynurae TaxID=452979 RepID=A0ABV5LQ68_9ACTN